MTFFPAILAVLGPLGNAGEIYAPLKRFCRSFFHEMTKAYVQSKAFLEHESKMDMKQYEQSEALA